MAETKQQRSVTIPEYVTVRQLAELVEATPIDVIKLLMSSGIMAGINQQVDFETAAIVAAELGFDPVPVVEAAAAEPEEAVQGATWRQAYHTEDPSKLVRRPPVVAVLGHVDHGKTSLLDKIRKANVTASEAGGITQHIGAYQVERSGQRITFLDTPGHEAFTGMRARGAHGADVAILVVAVDDGVMPQTREAAAHAKAAGVPIVVALNKVDRANARPDFVKQQLSEMGLIPDEWEGDTMMIPVSALNGQGIEDILEAVLLVADDREIIANPKGKTLGTVLEAELTSNRGPMATLLVYNGTLRVGDTVLTGSTYGRIKAMFDYNGDAVKEAPPSMPVQVMGLNEVPEPGIVFEVVKSEKVARSLIQEREQAQQRNGADAAGPSMSLEDLFARFQSGQAKEMRLVVKADVQGSLEPIVSSLEKISIQDTKHDARLNVNVLHADIGNVSESDVMLASASQAIVIGFQVSVDGAAQRRADSEGVEIRQYDIIYKLLEDIEKALEGLLEPVYEDKLIGAAEVRQVFRIQKTGNIAGCYVRDGEIRRDATARVVRGNRTLHEGKLTSLKRFQEDVKEVRSGFECGLSVAGFDAFEEGDTLQFFVRQRVR